VAKVKVISNPCKARPLPGKTRGTGRETALKSCAGLQILAAAVSSAQLTLRKNTMNSERDISSLEITTVTQSFDVSNLHSNESVVVWFSLLTQITKVSLSVSFTDFNVSLVVVWVHMLVQRTWTK
jgi:hypothetical protein